MQSIPRLSLTTHLPRRVFVPFTLSKGIHAEKLWEVVKTDRKPSSNLEVVAFFQTPKTGSHTQGEFVVRGALMQPNGRADVSLWRDGATAWRIRENGGCEQAELPDVRIIDLAIGLGGPKEFGLFISWNPGLSEFKHLFLGPGDTLPLSRASNGEDADGRETVQQYYDATKGEPFFLLDIPLIAVLPASTAANTYGDRIPQKLPATGFFSSLRLEWQFSSPRLQLSAVQPVGEDGFGIAIDFGTSASTVAVFPLVQDITRHALRAADPVANIAPWALCTEILDRATLESKTDTAFADHVAISTNSRAVGDLAAHPFFIDARRPPTPGRTQIPSILHAPEFKSGSRLDVELIVDDETTGPQCFIGDEVQQLIDEGIRHHPSDKAARTEWERYLYAPKSLVGRTDRDLPIREHIPEPIETYLRELFDQAFYTATLGGQTPRTRSRLLRSIAFSYPVTWTDHQRADYVSSVRSALEKSLLAPCLAEAGWADLFSAPTSSMDEASAAFLGFVMKRFSGLEGLQLLTTYQPFMPGDAVNPGQLKPINVLVFDCGEGTTDIVWLEIAQKTDGGNGVTARHVDSHVKRHFATEKAGLEVTRRVAQYMKELLLLANADADEHVRNWLCTKLDDKQFLGEFDHRLGSPRGPHRMGLVHLFYQAAERLKIGRDLGHLRKDLLERLQASKIKGGAELSISDDALQAIVCEVFDVAIEQVRSWFANGPRVDVVIMSGRSCRLPGIEQMLRDAIPAQFRPYEIDFVTPDAFLLEQATDGAGEDDPISKSTVVTGLVLNSYNARAVTGRALRCHPIDSMKATRAIGVMARGIAANNQPFFSDEFPLLVEANNEPIDSTIDLGPIVIEKGEAGGFSIGINFAGKRVSETDKVDPVQEFIRVSIQGGSNESVDSLNLYFRQYSSTDLRLSRLILKKPDGSELEKTLAAGDGWKPITVGPIRIICRPYSADTDFRNTGRIHIDADNSVDL